MAESGVSGFDVSSWYALFAPAKIPQEILKRMNTDTAAILNEPAMKAKLAPLGIEAAGSTTAELNGKARADTELWGGIIKSANIKGE